METSTGSFRLRLALGLALDLGKGISIENRPKSASVCASTARIEAGSNGTDGNGRNGKGQPVGRACQETVPPSWDLGGASNPQESDAQLGKSRGAGRFDGVEVPGNQDMVDKMVRMEGYEWGGRW
jgi:hypothetical protein